MIRNKKIAKRLFIDWLILVPYLILCILGILMVFSASSYQQLISGGAISAKALKQLLYFSISLATIFIVYHMNLEVFKNKKLQWSLLIGLFLLLIVVTVTGRNAGGAKRWIDIGIFKFQPSEVIPFVLVLYLSRLFSREKPNTPFSLKKYKSAVILCTIFILFVALQPNIAGSAMIFTVVLIMFLANGLAPLFTAIAIGGFLIFRTISSKIFLSLDQSWLPTKFNYLIDRFKIMENPFLDPNGKGFQTTNAYYAMYNGGWFGRGIGNSIQKKGYLPASDTDFIFAICIEELGIIGGLLILLLVFFLVGRMFLMAIRAKNTYHYHLLIGCGTILLLQVSVNVGSLLGYIPMTGVTFPFISYGGSSLLILSIVIGIVLNISGTEKRQRFLTAKPREVIQ